MMRTTCRLELWFLTEREASELQSQGGSLTVATCDHRKHRRKRKNGMKGKRRAWVPTLPHRAQGPGLGKIGLFICLLRGVGE